MQMHKLKKIISEILYISKITSVNRKKVRIQEILLIILRAAIAAP